MNDSAYLLGPAKKQRRYSFRAALRWIYHHFPVRLQNGVAVLLAFECRENSTDTWPTKALKRITNNILLYSLLVLRIAQRYYSDSPYYPFEDEIVLTTTRVIFTRSKRSNWPICLKLWQRTEDEVCDDRLIVRSDDYLLEGLVFNRKFAPGVYLGIASVIIHDDKKIQRGPLVKNPRKEQLHTSENGERNALVMRTLKKQQRLDQQLAGLKVDVTFLAHEIARMHRQLEQSPDRYCTLESITTKRSLNVELFDKAIDRLFPGGKNYYQWIGSCLDSACKSYAFLFTKRRLQGHIRRCHGDLKATNLWVRRTYRTLFRRELLALDCVDFKPEFSYIDILSDVAMLAIDLECLNPQDTDVAYRFLHVYLSNSREDVKQAMPLLEYYMTEKALVCTYVSVLYDNHQDELGRQYLQIACQHAQRLDEYIAAATLAAPFTLIETIQDS